MLNLATPPERDRSLSLGRNVASTGFGTVTRFVCHICHYQKLLAAWCGFIVTGYILTQVSPKRTCHESTKVIRGGVQTQRVGQVIS
jgi:hypothetical protein